VLIRVALLRALGSSATPWDRAEEWRAAELRGILAAMQPYREQRPSSPGEPEGATEMEAALRAAVETEAAARLEWGHRRETVVDHLTRMGATRREAQQIVDQLFAQRDRVRQSRFKLMAVLGVALLVGGWACVRVTLWIHSRVYDANGTMGAYIKSRSMYNQVPGPRKDVGPAFELTRVFGDLPLNVGVVGFIAGVMVVGVSAGALIRPRRRKGSDQG
jgi:hypothetical protein